MIETWVTQSRKGTMLNNGQAIAVQISNMKVEEASYFSGAEPYFRFWMNIRGAAPLTLDFRQSDLFTDTQNIDPNTNAHTVYRVAGAPSRYLQSNYHVPLELYRGTPK